MVDKAKDLGDAVVERKTEQGFTPGPWSVHDGSNNGCKCLSVSGGGHPIASVEKGEWGDSYPSIRQQKDTGSIEGKFEAYIERIPYGEIPESEALCNARLIAAAPVLYKTLENLYGDLYLLGMHEIKLRQIYEGSFRDALRALTLARNGGDESAVRPISDRRTDGQAS